MPLLLVWLTGVVELVTEKNSFKTDIWGNGVQLDPVAYCSSPRAWPSAIYLNSLVPSPLSLPVPSISPRVDLADGSIRAPVPSDRCGVPTGRRTNRL